MRSILLVVAVAMAAGTVHAQSPQDVFQQALRLESAQGDLRGAIKLYEEVASDFGDDRALGARALFRMGQAYETLGQSEAERTYRRIVADFADQADAVARAEKRLAAIIVPPAPRGLHIAAHWMDGGGFWGASLSADGQYFVNTDWRTSRLAYQRIGEDQSVELTPNREMETGRYQTHGRFSPDNRRIAFAENNSVWTYNRETGETSKLFEPPDAYIEVGGWSRDGSAIFMSVDDNDPSDWIAVIDAESGALLHRIVVGDLANRRLCLLEDRYMLYHKASRGDTDLVVTDLQTGAATSFLPGGRIWMKDCSATTGIVLVVDESFEERRIWRYATQSGMPVGQPVAVPQVHLESISIGLTNDGTLAYFFGNRGVRVDGYSVSTDGLSLGPQMERDLPVGQVIGWTRDGLRFALRLTWNEFLIREADGSDRTIVQKEITRRAGWTPDGSHLFTHGRGPLANTYLVDPLTGETVDSLIDFRGFPGREALQLWSSVRRDNETMCVVERIPGADSTRDIVCYEDHRSSESATGLQLSPDGTRVLIGSPNPDRSAVILTLVNLETGEGVVLAESDWYWGTQWYRDGSALLRLRSDFKKWTEFTRLELDGSAQPVFLRLTAARRVNSFAFHPDGDRIVLRSYVPGPEDDGLHLTRGLW